MAIDPLTTWRSTLAALPKVSDASWAPNFAAWYADRLVAITTDPAALVPTGFVFTFAQAIFAAQLTALTPVDDPVAGTQGFADAWETALLATTAVIASGSFIPPTSPATLFSVVSSTIIVPASIVAGKAKIMELVTAPSVSDPLLSEFPVKFREATLLLKITATGLDSTTPGNGGPLPLTATDVPLI